MATILAVDDAEVMRTLMKTFLEKAGHRVFLAASGEQAITVAHKTSADLVITDINMPGMSGLSLARKLRRIENYRSIPILIITTETDENKKKTAKSVGATGWIAKPISEDRLIYAVNKVLGH